MKNILTSILISGLSIFSLNLKASESPAVQKEIQQHIQVDSYQLTSSQKVEILFTTDKTGKVDFVLAKTENEQLRHVIEKQFSSLILPGLNPEVVNSVTLNIKLI